MEQKFQDPMEQAAKLLKTSEGQALAKSLQSIPESQRAQIQQAMESGKMAEALSMLAPWLKGPDTTAALSKLQGGGKLG